MKPYPNRLSTFSTLSTLIYKMDYYKVLYRGPQGIYRKQSVESVEKKQKYIEGNLIAKGFKRFLRFFSFSVVSGQRVGFSELRTRW